MTPQSRDDPTTVAGSCRSPVHRSRGPVPQAERALAPDLARGGMLLGIALANAAGVVFGGQPGAAPDPEGIERGLNLLMFTLVHARAYPVFAVMFGYGLVQLASRQEASGTSRDAVHALLLRRNAWLVAFGFVHAALLYFGDFLGAYGLVGMAVSFFLLPRPERVMRAVLWIWAVVVLEVLVLGAVVAVRSFDVAGAPAAVPFFAVASLTAPTYAESVLARLVEWPRHTATVLPFIVVVWLGVWAGRRRMLEEHARHRRLLWRVALGGLGVAIAGGLPLALTSAGVLQVDESAVWPMFLLHQVSGMFAGPGYVALFGLLAGGRIGTLSGCSWRTRSLAALGRRSLSGYLSQSVAWLVLLSPCMLGLGRSSSMPMTTAMAVALLVWVATLGGAVVLDRHARPGPAERLLRWLTYRSHS